jgi:hypothetical protein
MKPQVAKTHLLQIQSVLSEEKIGTDEEDPADLTMHTSNGKLRLKLKPLLTSDDG